MQLSMPIGNYDVKFVAGKFYKPITLSVTDSTIKFTFGFSRTLIKSIKAMDGARWNPDGKFWTVKNVQRNWFQIRRLMNENPYEQYDKPLIEFVSKRTLYDHQLEMVRFGLTRRCGIWACEMGTGKSLCAIEMMEHLFDNPTTSAQDIWYVGPKSGVVSVTREIKKWDCNLKPTMMTYHKLRNVVNDWVDGTPAPKFLIGDESSKLKNANSKQSQAFQHVADCMRAEHGEDAYVILMTGTPAPKSPVDWWSQAEVACPGFLLEGNHHKFKKELCLIEERESQSGGTFPHILAWLDDERRCATCGQFPEDEEHQIDPLTLEKQCAQYAPSVNEVARLYKRLQGLVLIKHKKDCLDLPEKQYQIVRLKPNAQTIRAAKLIARITPRAAQKLILLRELSDGFQYEMQEAGLIDCARCQATGTVNVRKHTEDFDQFAPLEVDEDQFERTEETCNVCQGKKQVMDYARGVATVESPKDDYLKELLSDHEDVGRLIVWGGFTATVERIVELCRNAGWTVLRVDGQGYKGVDKDGTPVSSERLLDALDASNPERKQLLEDYPKVVFVGQPGAGGMGLTLTASPTMLYYSNDFNGESRMQSEDRFHRAGMDENRGCTIIDLVHLPTDQLVLDNLKKKKKLQDITLGQIDDAFASGEINRE